MRPLRVSAISFLNTAPLMWDFEHEPTPELRERFAVSYTVPSACAEALRSGQADIGIVPVITTASIPGLTVVPDVAIAAVNEVRSILLVSKVPIEQIRTLALDTSSRTSVVLVQVLLSKFYGVSPELTSMAPELAPMLAQCDAGLLIGDPALLAETGAFHVYDLATLWQQHTGLPFVFAVWAVRKAALAEAGGKVDVAGIFQRSRDHGTRPESIEVISREWTARIALTPEDIRSYLTRNIYYKLDEPCLAGLRLYFRYAAELGLIAAEPRLEFVGERTGVSGV